MHTEALSKETAYPAMSYLRYQHQSLHLFTAFVAFSRCVTYLRQKCGIVYFEGYDGMGGDGLRS